MVIATVAESEVAGLHSTAAARSAASSVVVAAAPTGVAVGIAGRGGYGFGVVSAGCDACLIVVAGAGPYSAAQTRRVGSGAGVVGSVGVAAHLVGVAGFEDGVGALEAAFGGVVVAGAEEIQAAAGVAGLAEEALVLVGADPGSGLGAARVAVGVVVAAGDGQAGGVDGGLGGALGVGDLVGDLAGAGAGDGGAVGALVVAQCGPGLAGDVQGDLFGAAEQIQDAAGGVEPVLLVCSSRLPLAS